MKRSALAALFAAALAVPSFPAALVGTAPNVAKDPTDVPPMRTSVTYTAANPLRLRLNAVEVIADLTPGKRFFFWTFAAGAGFEQLGSKQMNVPTVPGPMIRVVEGETVALELCNQLTNVEPHNIDFHAVMGPGGGSAVTNVEPGECRTLTFKAQRAGAYIYHCAGEGMPWEHVAHGMYGLIQVDPVGGLQTGFNEYLVGQSEWYLTTKPMANPKIAASNVLFFDLDQTKAGDELPDLYSFNGHTAALTDPAIFGNAITVPVGSKLRYFMVTGGPNKGSNWHIIGTIFDKVYTGHVSTPVLNEETVYVAPGSAAVFELSAPVPGNYVIVDHALYRVPKGAGGLQHVTLPPGCTDPNAPGCWPTDLYAPPATAPTGH